MTNLSPLVPFLGGVDKNVEERGGGKGEKEEEGERKGTREASFFVTTFFRIQPNRRGRGGGKRKKGTSVCPRSQS